MESRIPSWLRWCGSGLVLATATCATAPPGEPAAGGPTFSNQVVAERWFTSPARCGQGPYDIEIDTVGGRWQERLDLVFHTPRRLRLTVALVFDGRELVRQTDSVGPRGAGPGPDNQRCVSDPRELAAALAKARQTSGSPGAGAPSPHAPSGSGSELSGSAVALVPAARPPTGQGWTLLEKVWGTYNGPDEPRPVGVRARFRFWSSVPNDFEGVTIGVKQIVVRPGMTDAAFDAWAQGRARREREAAARRQAARAPSEIAAERARADREAREAAARADREAREAAARAVQQERWKAYCNDHPEKSDCWGPGGLAVRRDLERRRGERETYCAAHPEEARCWSGDEWARRRRAWSGRATDANNAGPESAGPPPPARAEQTPPRPSTNADWRAGYWHWADSDWIWLAGVWRVPEADIRAEQTTHAPVAPPAPPPESVPSAPAPITVWTPGFWQWSGGGWVWVAGSWQLPPAPHTVWRPPHWTNRLGVFIFIPGGWVSVNRP